MKEMRRSSEVVGYTHQAAGARNGCGGMLNGCGSYQGCGSFQGCGHPNRGRSLPGATPAQQAWAAAKVVMG